MVVPIIVLVAIPIFLGALEDISIGKNSLQSNLNHQENTKGN